MSELRQFIRTTRGAKKGILVAKEEGDKILVGFSLCSNDDVFDREKGLEIATGRARRLHSANYAQMFADARVPAEVVGTENEKAFYGKIPHSIRGEVFAFLKRVERVKAFEGKELPAWAKTALFPQ